MRCEKPWVSLGQAFPCGQCLACRLNRRRVWTCRIMLEGLKHKDACFLTLSYRDSCLPLTSNGIGPALTGMGLPTLRPKDLSDWLKRLRKALYPLRLRYFAVGEYGHELHRPHYHAIVFGLRGCDVGTTQVLSHRALRGDDPERPTCCKGCRLIFDTWGHGRVFVGSVTPESAQYVAGYTVDKLRGSTDLVRYTGRVPDFARMSLKPGIGASGLDEIAERLIELGLDESQADVPVSLAFGKKQLPLGRFLRKKLRNKIGKDERCPPVVAEQLQAQMLEMRLVARSSKDGSTFGKVLRERSKGEIANIRAHYQLYGRKKGQL